MVLFGTPEWLAPYPNMAAPATLAPCPCHRGNRAVVEVLTRPKGAPAKVAPPLIPRRQHGWRAPPLRAPPTSPPPKFSPSLFCLQATAGAPPPDRGARVAGAPLLPPSKPFCLRTSAGAALMDHGARVAGAAFPQPETLLPRGTGWRRPSQPRRQGGWRRPLPPCKLKIHIAQMYQFTVRNSNHNSQIRTD
uniref:Uncharacterized protein n=1 Tax=Oryza sativa subsp. japonica TaxID=39947 RepID=Q6YXG9_ORYSJ|nr:hypothetical protein [Oryza sativa Japonica Group]